jgi:arylsulfatase A-like enzyme
MSWWHGCDHVGHEEGPDSPDIAKQLRAQDAQLARLLAGLDARHAWDHTTLLVVSDHGMTAIDARIDAQAALAKAGVRARVANGGGDAQVYLNDAKQRETALAALAKLEGLRAFANDALPAGLRSFFPGRSGDLTLVATPPGVLAPPLRTALHGGGHGYDPELPDMGAIFFALGRGVPAGTKLAHPRAIDVAPTAAALLGIEPPLQSEGAALFAPPGEARGRPRAQPAGAEGARSEPSGERSQQDSKTEAKP